MATAACLHTGCTGPTGRTGCQKEEVAQVIYLPWAALLFTAKVPWCPGIRRPQRQASPLWFSWVIPHRGSIEPALKIEILKIQHFCWFSSSLPHFHSGGSEKLFYASFESITSWPRIINENCILRTQNCLTCQLHSGKLSYNPHGIRHSGAVSPERQLPLIHVCVCVCVSGCMCVSVCEERGLKS